MRYEFYLISQSNILNLILNDQHRIAIAVKAVFLFHCNFVSVHYVLITAKGTNHHQQGRFRRVEVSYH
jgi:hypothetical protein